MVSFDSEIRNTESPAAIDFDSQRNVLMLAFGGLALRIGIPMYEFNNISRDLTSINKIYLRDKHRLWYHRGLPAMGNDIGGLVRFLRQYTAHPSTRRTLVFGNSGGGYAALLFGQLLQADEVHAFSPKTFINPVKRLLRGDIDDGKLIGRILSLYRWGQRNYFDLRKILLDHPVGRRHIHVYYAIDHKWDALHAKRLQGLPDVHLHAYPYGKHNLIRKLKDSGELRQIIERAVKKE